MPTNLTIVDRLTRLLNFYEHAAAAIRTTMALMDQQPETSRNGWGGDRRSQSNGSIAKAALQIDAQRRAGTLPKKKHLRRDEIRAQRERSAAVLAHFDPKEPKLPGEFPINPKSIQPLVRWGFLKKKGPGYVRTAKPFHVDKRAAQ